MALDQRTGEYFLGLPTVGNAPGSTDHLTGKLERGCRRPGAVVGQPHKPIARSGVAAG